MKTIRISKEAYEFLAFKAKQEKRSLVATLDLFVQIYKESQDEQLAEEGLPKCKNTKT